MIKAEAGRLGGLTTFLRYGSDYMSQTGRMGGRPRDRQQSAPENRRFDGNDLPRSLRELKGLWKLQVQGKGGEPEESFERSLSERGAIPPLTPNTSEGRQSKHTPARVFEEVME